MPSKANLIWGGVGVVIGITIQSTGVLPNWVVAVVAGMATFPGYIMNVVGG